MPLPPGLHMVLDSQSDQCRGGAPGGSPGIRLVVHPQGRMALPEQEGLTLGPGQATSISMKQVLLTRLGDQYHQCSSTDSHRYKHSNMYTHWYSVGYSIQVRLDLKNMVPEIVLNHTEMEQTSIHYYQSGMSWKTLTASKHQNPHYNRV